LASIRNFVFSVLSFSTVDVRGGSACGCAGAEPEDLLTHSLYYALYLSTCAQARAPRTTTK
jgi:hypothetical protein